MRIAVADPTGLRLWPTDDGRYNLAVGDTNLDGGSATFAHRAIAVAFDQTHVRETAVTHPMRVVSVRGGTEYLAPPGHTHHLASLNADLRLSGTPGFLGLVWELLQSI